jgi:hypothetical protein
MAWAAADSPDLAKNGRPGSVSSAGCTRRTRTLRGMHLGARVGETGAEEGCTAAACGHGALARNYASGKAGKRGKTGQQYSLRQRGAPGALARRRKAAERQRIRRSRCGGCGLARLGFAR